MLLNPSLHPERASLSRLPNEIKTRIIVHVLNRMKKFAPYSHEHWHILLSSVNRNFYELCCPFNWGELNLFDRQAPQLERLIQDALPRQANHVRSIRLGRRFLGEEFPEKQLRRVLKMCTNLSQLVVDIDTADLDHDGNFLIDPSNPVSTMLEPISQLSNLTHLFLRNCVMKKQGNNGFETCCWFDEEFVLKIIKNMTHLVSVRLDRIGSPHRIWAYDDSKSEGSIPRLNVSPLAVHLASLPSLKFLNLTSMHCFDSGWSQIKWRGVLEGFTLRETNTTLRAFHDFCRMFSDSLVFISLHRNDVHMDNSLLRCTLPSDLQDRFLFRLPNLKRLSICNDHVFPLLQLFRESRNIFRVSLMNMCYSHISFEEIESLINWQTSPWPHLESVLIHVDKKGFSREEKLGLLEVGKDAGVKVEIGALKAVRKPFFEDDAFSSHSEEIETVSSYPASPAASLDNWPSGL
ncbi:hypothetical protein PCANC_12468 [Puccinia coronata f. sp. avenae]|uniref:F-box domain-containing protein n=1 Tax=Puccinia coronata f. sp. avenae TaxID=200324 RepID=A0A2N5UL54_9BASI|nr:hypothetical protein PCANC_12468 [Puccinia coronata f. sp. avenae]PLW44685.1 hypothetical protein PCASD_05881 [Puccinia coronata f. sp. avenae]